MQLGGWSARARERPYCMSRNKDVFEFAEGKDIGVESEVERSTKGIAQGRI